MIFNLCVSISGHRGSGNVCSVFWDRSEAASGQMWLLWAVWSLVHHTTTKAATTSWKVCMVAPCSVQNTQLSITAPTRGFGVPYRSTLRTSHQI